MVSFRQGKDSVWLQIVELYWMERSIGTTSGKSAAIPRSNCGRVLMRFRCELRSRHPDRVEFHADQLAQSVQRAPTPGRGDRFVRALLSPVSALLRARRRTGGRTWCRGGCQLYVALC